MILWHAGIAAVITYVTLGRSRIDYRFILLGAIAPDVVDGVLSITAFPEWEGRAIAHSIFAVVVVAVVVLVAFKGPRRIALFGFPVGWLLHLVADGMWSHPTTFLWPAFGTAFATSPEPYTWDLFTTPLDHLATWGGEFVGIVALAWFYVAFELRDPQRLRRFLRDGLLRA